MQKKPKSSKRYSHGVLTPHGMGDYYGTGIRQKLGKSVEGMGMKEVSPKKMKTPPKSLA